MNKNKIIIDSNDYIIEKSGIYFLKPINDKYTITVNNNIECKLIITSQNSTYNINYLLNDNSKLVVNSLNYNSNTVINLDLMENTYLEYNNSVVAKSDSINSFIINHSSNNSTSILNNNGINFLNNKLHFVIDGVIKNNLVNINCNECSKIINFDNGNSKIIPNLIIDSNDIIANHSAYIGKVNDDVKFYLQSRGISEDNVKKLIYKGILLSKMEFSIIDEFTKLINEWW